MVGRFLAAAGLGAIAPWRTLPPPVPPRKPAGPHFSHQDFDAFLRRFVDRRGRVDYAAAAHDRADLDRYLGQLAGASPDSDPELFPGEDDRLAYWINAYNASAIALVLAHYPIRSVRDVRPPRLLFFLPREAGFFLLRRFVLGGRRVTLYGLENRIVRRRFDDPRIHFALNCASLGCPRLPSETFTGDALQSQLDRETRRFLGEARNLRVDPATRTLWLSSILDWYEDDFVDWLCEQAPDAERSVRGYLLHVLPTEAADRVRRCDGCEISFVPYDWSLNDRGASRASGRDPVEAASTSASSASRQWNDRG